ncbi:BatD family protein [Portibacter marinus]|uniref:BatD family protein n=1 Tax=Portibacter marinus TaxID=2898660 RepID=UPI001F338364|nr:BatD family protein [Portibacter marinus]
MRTIITIILMTIGFSPLWSQEGENIDKYITAMVASDTILEGNSFEFKIVIRNLKGDFTPPSFSDFDIVGGPNLSTNMQFINGNMFRESTYTYYLKARQVGEHYIEESYLEIEGENIETEAIPVYILDNPEQIKKEYKINGDTRSELIFPYPFGRPDSTIDLKKRSKRKLKKI